MKTLTVEKAKELLKNLQYAKFHVGSLSTREEYYLQSLEHFVETRQESTNS